MISTIVARRPLYSPWVKSTTRPTSTSLHWAALILMSAIPGDAMIENNLVSGNTDGFGCLPTRLGGGV